MAFGITAYSEAAFASESNDVFAYPQGSVLTGSLGNAGTPGTANIDVTGSQATITNAGAVAGSSVQFSVSGIQLTSSIGEETIDIGVTVTGQELSISNKEFTQDTLTAFGQAPFSTLSPSTIEVPIVDVFTTTGGDIGDFALTATLGSFSVSANGNVSVIVTEHTMNSSVGSVSVTGIGNVSVSGNQITSSIGSESASASFTAEVTGSQLTMSIGEETPAGNADASITGIQLTSSIGTASQATIYDVTGIQMASSIGSVAITGTAVVIPTGIQLQSNTGTPNVTPWNEIDLGVSNVWTEVDRAA